MSSRVKILLLSISVVLTVAIMGVIIALVLDWVPVDPVGVALIAAWVAIGNVVLAQVVTALLANDKAQTDSLQGYLKEMGEALAEKSELLRDPGSDDSREVILLARAHTRTVLSGLNRDRKAIVLRYLDNFRNLDNSRLTSILLTENEEASLRKETGVKANGESDPVTIGERANASAHVNPPPDIQNNPAPKGAVVSAVLVHRAEPSNVVGNWTYLDHQLLNGDPNAILLITQNWNPGGGEHGKYNEHPVGVWYDPRQHRWAIFNQDIEDMPSEAAFNVAILEDSNLGDGFSS
jgi:hypothetical protein